MGTENVNANGLSDLREITLDEQTILLSRDAVGDPLTLKKIDLSRCTRLEEIGDYCFMFADNLEEVVLPEGLRRIGVTAFKGCRKLKKINIPASVECIDAYAFKNCTSLTEVDLGQCTRLEELSVGVFEGAENLRSVVLPEGMKRLCSRAFYKCNELDTVKLPSTVVKVGTQLLYWNYEVDWERCVIAVEGTLTNNE